jgi:hypothetical protein
MIDLCDSEEASQEREYLGEIFPAMMRDVSYGDTQC